jgi:hypothetical protein
MHDWATWGWNWVISPNYWVISPNWSLTSPVGRRSGWLRCESNYLTKRLFI